MSAARALAAGLVVAGAGYAIMSRRRPTATAQPVVQPVSYQPAPQSRDYTPLINWGMDNLMFLTGKKNPTATTAAPSPVIRNPLSGLFGGGGSVPASTSSGRADVNGLLGLIGSLEAPAGYDQVYGGSKIRTPRPLTKMTVDEVLNWQSRSVAAGSKSSAAGRYQIIRKTLRSLKHQGHVRGTDLFNKSTQDRLGRVLLERRGLSRFQSGKINATQFAQNLSQEWASLPAATRDRKGRKATGQSYYAGDGLNRSHTTIDRVLSFLGG